MTIYMGSSPIIYMVIFLVTSGIGVCLVSLSSEIRLLKSANRDLTHRLDMAGKADDTLMKVLGGRVKAIEERLDDQSWGDGVEAELIRLGQRPTWIDSLSARIAKLEDESKFRNAVQYEAENHKKVVCRSFNQTAPRSQFLEAGNSAE